MFKVFYTVQIITIEWVFYKSSVFSVCSHTMGVHTVHISVDIPDDSPGIGVRSKYETILQDLRLKKIVHPDRIYTTVYG